MIRLSTMLATALLVASMFAPNAFTPKAYAQEQDISELVIRLERMENQMRQMTGTIEQLQYRNQQLEQQLRAMQMNPQSNMQPSAQPQMAPAVPPPPPAARPMQGGPSPVNTPVVPAVPGRRGDVFDPSQQPNAPGAPRALGGGSLGGGQMGGGAMGGGSIVAQEPLDNSAPVGAPGGREAGAPLDLTTMARNDPGGNVARGAAPPPPGSNVPFNTAPMAGPAVAMTAPPGNTPKDEYDLAYGYVLRKDYAQAEITFRDFIRKYPSDPLSADAQYWLGESLFQRQRYQDAADSFLVVIRKHDKSGKAPDSLLRLGQSLAAIGQKEMACASLNEVGRKYPKASASVKRGVEQEQKRAKC